MVVDGKEANKQNLDTKNRWTMGRLQNEVSCNKEKTSIKLTSEIKTMRITRDSEPVSYTVEKVKKCDNGEGVMEYRDIEDYGGARAYWIPNDTVTHDGYWERKRRSYIPNKYVGKESKDFNWSLYGPNYESSIRNIKENLNNFVRGFERFCSEGIGLYINSLSHGSGKTLLGCVVADAIMKRINYVSAKYTTVPDYLELMKGKGDQRMERNREYRECTLLVLDEMGSGKSDWDRDILKSLISYRMSQYKPIIYISSCSMDKLTGDDQMIALIQDMSKDIGLPPVNVRNKLAEERKRELFEKAAQKEDKEKAF